MDQSNESPHTEELKSDRKVCGIVRPIASMDEYTSQHWKDVHSILADAANSAGYDLKLVSETDVSGTILGDIVHNLYYNSVVICDVSGRNPNVMFELGMRLAFEKPVIIVVDDETPFSFDISPIKHVQYPRTLRYGDIIDFKQRVVAAFAAIDSGKGDKAKGYLQQFGPIEVTQLGSNKVDVAQVAEQVANLTRAVSSLQSSLKRNTQAVTLHGKSALGGSIFRAMANVSPKMVTVSTGKIGLEKVKAYLNARLGSNSITYVTTSSDNRGRISFIVDSEASEEYIGSVIEGAKEVDPSIKIEDPIFD